MGNELSSVNPDPSGTINVEITAPRGSCGVAVRGSGYHKHAITDEERELFRITDKNLKAAVEDDFGKKPTDAFLTSPTLYGDMYARYENFYPVLTTVKLVSAKISGQPRISNINVATRRFINKSNQTGTFETTFSETESNTISSTWSRNLECGLDVSYDIGLPVTPKFSLCNKFGNSLNRSKSVTITSQSRVSTTLGPRKAVVVHLRSKKYTVFVKVTYKVTLEGHVACNYEGGYEGHTFWALPVNKVLESAGLPTVLETSEILELNYFTDGEIEMSDINTNCSATDDYCFRHGVRDYYL